MASVGQPRHVCAALTDTQQARRIHIYVRVSPVTEWPVCAEGCVSCQVNKKVVTSLLAVWNSCAPAGLYLSACCLVRHATCVLCVQVCARRCFTKVFCTFAVTSSCFICMFSAVWLACRVRDMLASRACRTSIMIGAPLSRQQQGRILARLAELAAPFNCPHGRPTMRHLAVLPR